MRRVLVRSRCDSLVSDLRDINFTGHNSGHAFYVRRGNKSVRSEDQKISMDLK
jgi:hypothetical protein